MTRTAAGVGSVICTALCVVAVVLWAGRVVERVFDLSLPTPIEAPPTVFGLTAVAAGALASRLHRVAEVGPEPGDG